MRKNRKKALSAGVAVTLCGVLMLSGTLAWSSIKQTAKNEIMGGQLRNPGGRLHDDFNGNTGDKNIYVENFTGALDGQEIIVRIRLREYEAIGATNVENRETDTSKWTVFNLNTDGTKHGHWNWQMGGEAVYMPTFDKNKDSKNSDLNGTYEGSKDGDDVHFDDFVSYEVGKTKTAIATYDADDDDVYDENTGVTKQEETHTATTTINGTVYTMQEWEALETKTGDFWVCGDDGWAYWANPLMPGTATAPLLNQIGMDPNNPITDEWYYGIYVESEMVTADEISTAKKEVKEGFYHNHAGDGADCTEDCQGECPSDDMQSLLELIAGKCSQNTAANAIWLSDEEAGVETSAVVSENRQTEIQKIYQETLAAEAALEEASKETETVTEDETAQGSEEPTEEADQTDPTAQQPDTEQAKEEEGTTEQPEEVTPAETVEETKTGALATFFNLFKSGVR